MANHTPGEPRRPRAVAHCIFRRDGKVLLIRIVDPESGAVGWRAAGGGIEWRETAEDACRREIREELGIELASLRMLGVCEGFITWRGVDEHEIVVMFEGTPADWSRLAEDRVTGIEEISKALDLRWISPDQAIASGELLYPTGLARYLARPAEPARAIALCALERNGEYLVFEAWDSVKQRPIRRFAGGGIDPGELAEQAIRRELQEELDTGIEDVRLLGVLENVFKYHGEPGHEVVFLFAARATNPEIYAREEVTLTEGDQKLVMRWIAKELLNEGAEFVPPGALELLS